MDEADLRIDDLIHQTFVAVDETGTEAAAATAITTVVTSATEDPPPIEFRADHSFVFLIRDDRSGAVLFLGRLEAPPG